MTWTNRMLPLAMTVAFAACNEAVGPAARGPTTPEPTYSLHHLRWEDPMGADRFSAVAGVVGGEELALVLPPTFNGSVGTGSDSLSLSSYAVSFWAVSGEDRFIQIDYLNTDSTGQTTTSPFLQFSLTQNTLLAHPDGSPIATGDSVLITISVDSTDLVAHMAPSGLLFDPLEPALLQVWYNGANPDLNTDGTVNSTDDNIEANDLGVWVQQNPGEPWIWVPSEQLLNFKMFEANLEHFSSYAISW